MENLFYIVRWSGFIEFPDGVIANMACRSGTREEVEAYAQEIAKDHGVVVEAIL